MPKASTEKKKTTANTGSVKHQIVPALLPLMVPIKDLQFDPENARLHPDANKKAIMRSLETYGQVKPVVVQQSTGIVTAGNGTLESAISLGWTHIAATMVDFSDEDATGFGLADNRTAELAEWDLEVVKRLTQLREEQGLENVGWDKEDLAAIWAMDFAPRTDPDEVPEIPKVPISKKGDLWLLGDSKDPHRLICGDSSDIDAVKKLMNGRKAFLMATDPPYGVDFSGAKYNPRAKAWAGIKGDKRQGMDLEGFMVNFLEAWQPHMEEQAAYYFWTAAMEEGHAMYRGIKESGLHIQSSIIWAKNVFAMGQADYQWKHEQCWYAFQKGKHHRWYGGRTLTTLWEIKRIATSAYLHPMQKPVELYGIPIDNHTRASEVVAEPFCGSGTQIIAAQTAGRICYAMELDPIYVDVTLARFAAYTGTDPIRSDGKKFSSLRK